jgi:hypothetical protein
VVIARRLDAKGDPEIVRKKFEDYGTSDTDAKANKRLAELSEKSTADAFRAERRRFLPAKRVKQISDAAWTNLYFPRVARCCGNQCYAPVFKR